MPDVQIPEGTDKVELMWKDIKGDGGEKNNWKIVIGKYNVESMIIPWCAKNFNQSEETQFT